MEQTPNRMLGNGMLRMSAEDVQLYPVFQQEMIDAQVEGRPILKYEDWKKMRQQLRTSSIGNY